MCIKYYIGMNNFFLNYTENGYILTFYNYYEIKLKY